MSEYLAVVLGILGVVSLLFFIWKNIREEHPGLAIVFLGSGLVLMEYLSVVIYLMMKNEASIAYLDGSGTALIVIINVIVLVAILYIIIGSFGVALKTLLQWIQKKVGFGGK